MGVDRRTGGPFARGPRPAGTVGRDRDADEGRSGPSPVGDEPLPGPGRDPPPRTPRPGDGDRRAAGGAQGLSDAPELHLPVRADLDLRDRPPPREGLSTGTFGPVPGTEGPILGHGE